MEWKDVTPYKRGQVDRTPTGWQIEDPEHLLRVTVVYGHIQAPGHWCFHCHQLGFDTVELLKVPQSLDAADQAKAEAIRYVLARLHCMSGAAVKMAQATPLSGIKA